MNASKENARKARQYFDATVRPVASANAEKQQAFVREFLDAALRKLPTEEAFDREKNRRKRPVSA